MEEGAHVCYCGRNAPTKTSWTDLNPGRRFSCCEKDRKEPGRCDFFVWIDPPMCERSRLIIPGLLRKKKKLEDDLKREKKIAMAVWVALLLTWSVVIEW